MTVLSPNAKQQFFDANGNPLAGGKLYTYAAGTTTPLATYSDYAGTQPNTNPIILDSRGEALIYLSVYKYKFKLTTSTDVEIWTVDNINSPLEFTNTLVSADRFEGTATDDAGTPDAVFRVKRTHTINAAPHSFRDQTTFTPGVDGNSACSYDAALTSTGSKTMNHTIAFQARNVHSGSNTMQDFFAFGAYQKTDGPITNSYGVQVTTITGSGTVTNEYGVYVANLTKGTNKYPIYVVDNLGTNYIGAATQFTGQVSVGRTARLFIGDGGDGFKSVAYNHDIANNTRFTADQIQSLYYGGSDITFRWAPTGSAGSTPTFTNLVSIRHDGGANQGAMYPGTDNTQNLGAGGSRWKEVFAGNGVINTSDARTKTPVRKFTDAEMNAAKQIGQEIGVFKFLDAVAEKGDAARNHIGMTVQRAIEIMKNNGLDPIAYGFICHDEWPNEYETQPNGMKKLIKKSGDSYGFRYHQLAMFIARGFEARLAKLEASK